MCSLKPSERPTFDSKVGDILDVLQDWEDQLGHMILWESATLTAASL